MLSPRPALSHSKNWLCFAALTFPLLVATLLFSSCTDNEEKTEKRDPNLTQETSHQDTQSETAASNPPTPPSGETREQKSSTPSQPVPAALPSLSFSRLLKKNRQVTRRFNQVSSILAAHARLAKAQHTPPSSTEQALPSHWVYPGEDRARTWLSPHGRHVAHSSEEGTKLIIYDSATRKPVYQFKFESFFFKALFSPNGKYLIIDISDKKPVICSLLNGRVVSTIEHPFSVDRAIFSSDSNYVTSLSHEGTISVYDMRKQRVIRSLNLREKALLICFSKNTDYLAYCPLNKKDKSLIKIYHIPQNKVIGQIKCESAIKKMELSEDGKFLFFSTSSFFLRTYEIASGKIIYKQETKNTHPAFRFLPNNEFVSVNIENNTLIFLDTQKKKITSHIALGSDISRIDISPDGQLLILAKSDPRKIQPRHIYTTQYYAELGTRLAIYHIPSKKHLATLQLPNSLADIAFSPDNRTLICSTSRGLHHIPVKDILVGTSAAITPEHQLPKKRLWKFPYKVKIKDLSLHKDIIALLCKDGKTLTVHQLQSGKKLFSKLVNVLKYVNYMKFTPDGEHIACKRGRMMTLYHIESEQMAAQSKSRDHIYHVDFTKDSHYIMTNCYKNRVELYDIKRDQPVRTYRHNAKINAMCVSEHGSYFATCSNDRTTQLYTIGRDSQQIATLHHEAAPCSLVISPCERYLASSSDDGQVILYDIEHGKEIKRLKHPVKVGAVAFSTDSTYLAAACEDGAILLHHITHGQQQVIDSQGKLLNQLLFTPDSRYMVAAGFDGTVSIYDMTQNRMLSTRRHTEEVLRISISADGTKLATLSQDNSIFVYDLVNQQDIGMIRHADNLLEMKFSNDGKKIYQATVTGAYSTDLN